MKLKNIFRPSVLVIALIAIAVSVIGGTATGGGMDWYMTLEKPSITPPGLVISVAWTIIYILTAISAIVVWQRFKRDATLKWIIGIFIANALLNGLWSFIFFRWHLIGLAIIEMILLEISTLALIFLIWPRSRAAAILLAPYAIWVLFATFLAYQFWWINCQYNAFISCVKESLLFFNF